MYTQLNFYLGLPCRKQATSDLKRSLSINIVAETNYFYNQIF